MDICPQFLSCTHPSQILQLTWKTLFRVGWGTWLYLSWPCLSWPAKNAMTHPHVLHHLKLHWSQLSVHRDSAGTIWAIAEHYAKTIIQGRYEAQHSIRKSRRRRRRYGWIRMRINSVSLTLASVSPYRDRMACPRNHTCVRLRKLTECKIEVDPDLGCLYLPKWMNFREKSEEGGRGVISNPNKLL